MSNPLEFGGRVVLIAGDSGETGKLVAQAFLSAGADVVNCNPELAEQICEAADRTASFIVVDSGDADRITALFESVNDRYGRLDVMVYVAGGAPVHKGHQDDSAENDIRRGLITPLHFNQAANRLMQQQEGGGTIINISCAGEPLSTPRPDALAAASAGLANLGSSLAVEWAPQVRVNTITTMLTQTEHTGSNGEDGANDNESGSNPAPDGTAQLPDIGNTCLFLASPLASYVNGTQLTAARV